MLVERDDDLADLLRQADEARSGTGRLVLLSGEAGIGKTALVARLAEDVSTRMATRRGCADDLTTASPLGVVVEALPELRSPADADGSERLQLLRRVRELLARTPTLLLLEDVHWADEATLDVLRYLGRRLADLPLLAVVTYRPEDVSVRHRLSLVLGDLAGRPGVTRRTLAPLSAAAVAELTVATGSGLDPADLHARTGGNPFFVTEVVAAPSERLPETVRDAVLARAARMSDAARRLLDAAAVLGRTEVPVLVEVAEEDETALDECVERGVLVLDGSAVGFRHELARVAVLEIVRPSRLRRLHAAALRVLRAGGSPDDRALAHHAAGCGDAEALLEHARRAATRAARLGAHREAAAQYRMALQAHRLRPTERAALLEQLSYECYLTDQLPEALAARRQAVEAYELAGDAAAAGAATRWLSRLSWFLGRNAESERYAQQAVALLEPFGDGHESAMAYSNLAQLRMLSGDADSDDGAVAWGRRALEIARRTGDREVEIHALNNVGTALATADGSEEGQQYLRRSLDLALAADAHEHAARAYTNLGSTAALRWRLREAQRRLTAGIDYCDERDLDSWSRYMSAWLAGVQAELGEYASAQRLTATLLNHPDLAPISRIPATVTAARIQARRGGDATELLREAAGLAASTGEKQRLVPVVCAQAEVAWLTGDDVGLDDALIETAWAAATSYPDPWELGELGWWLARVDRPRDLPVAAAPPFAAMLDGAWSEAAQAWRALDCPLWTALALGFAPELDAARAALTTAAPLGVDAVASALLRTRRGLGLPVPRGPRAANRDNPATLTVREMEVLTLVASGLSNADVAAQLYLSERTVGHHMSAVLRKLDQPTRARAIAHALRAGIVRQT